MLTLMQFFACLQTSLLEFLQRCTLHADRTKDVRLPQWAVYVALEPTNRSVTSTELLVPECASFFDVQPFRLYN